jgi:hypothetical protein
MNCSKSPQQFMRKFAALCNLRRPFYCPCRQFIFLLFCRILTSPYGAAATKGRPDRRPSQKYLPRRGRTLSPPTRSVRRPLTRILRIVKARTIQQHQRASVSSSTFSAGGQSAAAVTRKKASILLISDSRGDESGGVAPSYNVVKGLSIRPEEKKTIRKKLRQCVN